MKINTKLLLAFLLIALIPLVTIGIVFHVNAKESLTREVLTHLKSIAEIQRNRAESIVEQNLERLSLVSSRTQLRISLDSFVRNPNTEDQDKISKILLDARSSVSSFRDISVLTLDGKVIASTDAAKVGSTHLNDEVFVRGQNENTADIFFLDENQGLCVYLSGPLYLESKLLGVVVIESAADSILSSIKDYTGLGTTGETQLAKRDENGDAIFITPTRFDEGVALSRTVPKEKVDSPIIQALLKNEKLFTDTVDYRGEPVLAATEYISETDWGLVTKIDKAEALAPVARLQYILIMIVVISLALVPLVFLFLARTITRPIIKLAQMAVKVSEGNLTEKAEVTSGDEIGILARACNQMKDSLVKTNYELEQELTERKRTEARLLHLHGILMTIRKVNQLIVDVDKESELLQGVCATLVDGRNYKMAWIGFISESSYDVLPVAQAGFEDGYLSSVKITWDDSEYGKGPTGTAIKTRRPSVMRDIVNDERYQPWREQALKRGYVSSAALPLVVEDKTIGALSVYSAEPDAFGDDEIDMLAELAGDISLGIGKIRQQEKIRQSGEQLKQLQEYLQLQIDRMPIGLIVWDTEFRVQSWNPAAERIFGFATREALGKHPYNLIVPKEAQPHVDNIWRRLLEGDATAHSTNENITKDGRTIICDWANTPLKKDDATVVGVLSMVQDITQRKRAEEALQASEEKLRLMFKSVTDGITVTDLNGAITEVNERTVEMHGFSSKDDLLGRSTFELTAAGDHERAKMNMQKTLEHGSVKDIGYTLLKADGSEFPGELSASVLKDAAGNPVGFIAITRDITERKRMEEQLIIQDRLASIGELASGIAHELNNPLTSIIGFSELLLDKDIPKDVKEDLIVINREAQRTAGVVRNLLTFARKHAPAKQPVNINSIIDNVLQLRAYEQKVSNIQVNTRFAPDLPEVIADGFQLQQVFMNIIINAEYFMTEAHGRGNLAITTEQAGDIIRASFADDGPGIAEENLLHLFAPFFTTKEVGKGTGLGLSICYGIVTAHGGKIYAQSKLGKGATFIVELPISQ